MTGGTTLGGARDPASTAHVFRTATPDDLPTCAAIWRDALNGYLVPLAQPEVPDDLGAILRLYAHLQSSDPETFLVAERAGTIEAFAVVLRRERLTFLSMLFVAPDAQGRGLGRALLDRAMGPTATAADAWRATATDSAQPISNGLYASLGIVPRVPLVRLVGLPTRPGAFPALPHGIDPVAFRDAAGDVDGLGSSALAGELGDLDRAALGFERSVDHRFLATEGREGFLYCDVDRRPVGYGYTSESGRLGPVVVRDRELLGPVLGHLVTAVEPRGSFGTWVPGSADEAIVPLLRAGFRIEGFPVLLCWDRPFADFSRVLPISPGLL